LLRLYERYNGQYFNGQLPIVKLRVRPATEEDRGLTAEYDPASGTISFFSSGATDESVIRTRLLHEMVHVARPEDGHGAPFRTELQRLAEMGAEGAEYEVWRMVGDDAWDDGWIGEETGRWERFREDGDT
jgi:hypothetical protein